MCISTRIEYKVKTTYFSLQHRRKKESLAHHERHVPLHFLPWYLFNHSNSVSYWWPRFKPLLRGFVQFRVRKEILVGVCKSLKPLYLKDRKSTIPMLTRASSIILCPLGLRRLLFVLLFPPFLQLDFPVLHNLISPPYRASGIYLYYN